MSISAIHQALLMKGAGSAFPSLPYTFTYAGYGLAAKPTDPPTDIQIPVALVAAHAALGVTIPTLPDYFGTLQSKLTNANESDGGSSWAPLDPALPLYLIYYSDAAPGTPKEILIDAGWQAKNVSFGFASSTGTVTITRHFTDATTSASTLTGGGAFVSMTTFTTTSGPSGSVYLNKLTITGSAIAIGPITLSA